MGEKSYGYQVKGKELSGRAQIEQLVSEKSVDIAYMCAEGRVDYVIIDASRLLELVKICSNFDCIYFVHKT